MTLTKNHDDVVMNFILKKKMLTYYTSINLDSFRVFNESSPGLAPGLTKFKMSVPSMQRWRHGSSPWAGLLARIAEKCYIEFGNKTTHHIEGC